MPQFPMSESRRSILERIPDYEVAISKSSKTIVVSVGDEILAESRNALLIQETRHADVYYLPRSDVNMPLLTATDHSTYCPFKGHANYFSFNDLDNVVWTYEDPYPEVSQLKSYLSFYANRVSQTVSG